MSDIPYAEFLDEKPVENKCLGKSFKRIECPKCGIIYYEEFDYAGKQVTKFYEQHYREDHLDCKNDPDNCDCDKSTCGRKCGC